MSYNISDYSFRQAQKIGVKIIPSTRKNKKIDVYNNNNEYIVSIGDIKYKDYPTYLIENGLIYAQNRRRLYKARHERNRNNVGSAGYYADKILW
jgi:hypothetical protein